MALSDYKMTSSGGIRAPKRAKKMILDDLKKATKSPQEMGLSKSEREQMTDEAKVTATQQARAASEDLAQAGLAGGGFTGYKAEGARQAQKASSGAAAAASAGAQQLSKQLAKQKYDQTRARLEAQQERSRQNAQFWAQQGVNLARGVAEAAAPLKNLFDK